MASIVSLEQRIRISETLKRKGIKPPLRTGCSPWNKGLKGIHLSPNTEFKKGRKSEFGMLGKNQTEEAKLKIGNALRGENHYLWIKDRAQLKKQDERNDPAYKEWVKECKKRDKECRLKSKECDGYLVVHHIKPWRDYPELRYEISNGILLCQHHHPRKRGDEIRLIPTLIKLVGSYKQ